MIKEIITDVDLLADAADNINLKTDRKLATQIITDLKDTIDAEGLLCLSAPQIGYNYRIVCIKYTPKGKSKTPVINTYINPIVTKQTGIVLDRETDPCLPGREFIYPRSANISLMYQTPMRKAMSQNLVGRYSAVMQQMIDHLDGIMIDEIGLEIDERFDEAPDEEKDQLLDEYTKALDLYRETLQTETDEDKDLKQMQDAVDFMQSVRSGETQLGGMMGVTDNNEVIEIAEEDIPQ